MCSLQLSQHYFEAKTSINVNMIYNKPNCSHYRGLNGGYRGALVKRLVVAEHFHLFATEKSESCNWYFRHFLSPLHLSLSVILCCVD